MRITAITRRTSTLYAGAIFLASIAFGQVGAMSAQAAPVGSGTIRFAIPARYGTGVSITSYLCQNTFLSLPQTNGATSAAPEEPAMGIQGLLHGHTFQALFSARHTFVSFENISLTPSMQGGPAPTYVQGEHVAGTIAIATFDQTGTRRGSGTVTVDFSCTDGTSPTKSATATAHTSTSSSSSETATIALLVVLAGAVVGGLIRVKTRKVPDSSRCARAQAEVSAAEAELKAARASGDAHYRAMGDLRLEGAILSEDENRQSPVDREFESALAERTRIAEERLARAREVLRICLAGGPDASAVAKSNPTSHTFDPAPPKAAESDGFTSDRQDIG